MTITNDTEFKAMLGNLSIMNQRKVAVAFVESVLPLCVEPRIETIAAIVKRDEVTEQELTAAYQLANTVRIESFCRCGQEVDWRIQLKHFIAKAALDCAKSPSDGENLAWSAALDARIARTCAGIANGECIERQETENQYRILSDFLRQQGEA